MPQCNGRTYRRRKRERLARKSIQESDLKTHENLNLFYKWIGKMGYKPTRKLKPKLFQDSGRGLMAEERICAGDTIIAIPENLLITPEKVSKSEVGLFINKCLPKATGHQMLSVFLLFEKAKVQVSEWYHYIKTLPEAYNIPAFYGRQCLPFIPSFIHPQATKQIETVEDSFKELRTVINGLENNFPFLHGCLTFEEFKWSWSTVNTRCVFIDCLRKDCVGKLCPFHLAMAPFLDLLNHNAGVQVQAGFNRSTRHYEITSHCDFNKYSQVFINYGQHSNCDLLLEYGFVTPHNANDTVLFSLDDIVSAYKDCNPSLKDLERKLNFILENDVSKNSVCSCDGFSWNLNITLRLLSTDYDSENWKSQLRFYLDVTGGSECRKLHEQLLFRKLQEYANSSKVSKNCPCTYSALQKEVNELLKFHTSILLKAMG